MQRGKAPSHGFLDGKSTADIKTAFSCSATPDSYSHYNAVVGSHKGGHEWKDEVHLMRFLIKSRSGSLPYRFAARTRDLSLTRIGAQFLPTPQRHRTHAQQPSIPLLLLPRCVAHCTQLHQAQEDRVSRPLSSSSL